MEAILKKQLKSLESLETMAKQDRLIQVGQLIEEKRLDEENDKSLKELQNVNKNLKIVVDKLDKNGKDNVIKLSDYIRKAVSTSAAKPALGKSVMSAEHVDNVTDTAVNRQEYETPKQRLQTMKTEFKELFTLKGFGRATGLAPKGGENIISKIIDRKEAKENYVNDRNAMDPTKHLHGEEKAKQIFGRQWEEQQNVQGKIKSNEDTLARYREQGFTEDQIKRSDASKGRAGLAADLAAVDPRVREKKGGVVAAKETTAKVIPFKQDNSSDSLSSEENILEQNRMIAEQTELLKKIETNTRGAASGKTKDQAAKAQPAPAPQEEGGGLLDGAMDFFGRGGRGGRAIRAGGSKLLQGAKGLGKFALKRAGPLAAAAAVAEGAYSAYTGWGDANDKEKASLDNVEAQVKSGAITEDQAKAMRKDAKETAVVDKSKAVGEGGGSAVGGAAGAMKGMAVGAAIGSAIPVVGTVVGGAVGAVVGGLGGSWLGGKAGGWLGEKFGQAKNALFPKSGAGESVKAETTKQERQVENYSFSEMTFSQKDPENYQKFVKYREELTKKYLDENLKSGKYGKSPQAQEMAYKSASTKARLEAVRKFKDEAEKAGALSGAVNKPREEAGGKQVDTKPVGSDKPGEKTSDALKGAAAGVKPTGTSESYTKIANERVIPGKDLSEKQMATIGIAKSQGNKYSPEIEAQYAKQLKQPTAAGTPSSGDMVSKASGENDKARMEAQGGGGTIVSAPSTTVNNSKSVNNMAPKMPPKNSESSVNKYYERSYSF